MFECHGEDLEVVQTHIGSEKDKEVLERSRQREKRAGESHDGIGRESHETIGRDQEVLLGISWKKARGKIPFHYH